MNIQIDTREKERAIRKIIETFDDLGVNHFSSKLYIGDYMSLDNPRVIIDRKQNLLEVSNNVCQDHQRFRAELQKALAAGIHLIVLVEHGQGIKSLEDVIFWENPRTKASSKAMTGERLYKVLNTIERKYGCEFLFCDKANTGKEIVRILNENN